MNSVVNPGMRGVAESRMTRWLFLAVQFSVAAAVDLGSWSFLKVPIEESTLLGALAAFVVGAAETMLYPRSAPDNPTS